MKLHDPFTYGRSETRKLEERLEHDSSLQAIYSYIKERNDLINNHRDPENPNRIIIPGYKRVGFHIHFPEIKGWYDRKLKRFNPDKLEDLARRAHLQGFDIITVSNKYDDQVFGHEPGYEFNFSKGRIIVLKAQEAGHVMPFGYSGRIDLNDIINSTLNQGGLYVICHPSNIAYHGAGEEWIARYKETAIIETLSPLVNHPRLNLSFADVIAKEWSLKYTVPGVSALDARRYLFGGFFVPAEGNDFSSAQNTMASFASLFQQRREELRKNGSLDSKLIINTEGYPLFNSQLLEELTSNISTSLRNSARKFFFGRLKNKNIGLREFDYQGVAGEPRTHVYLLRGDNDAAAFAHEQQPLNLVFYRNNGLFVGTTFSNAARYPWRGLLKRFNPTQILSLGEMIEDERFEEFSFGLHPTYPIACITPEGQKYVFVAKEFLPEYNKGRMGAQVLFGLLNMFVYRGQEGLRMAALQSTLQNIGLNVIPPLYVETSRDKSRIISPYFQLDSLSKDCSKMPEVQRRKVLEYAADRLALAKSRGVYLTDMHLGNIATETGDWFNNREPRPIFPDITVPGTSVTTFGDSHYNFLNPLAIPIGPRTTFVRFAMNQKHRLIQSFGDFFYFNEAYRDRLKHYTNNPSRT